MEALLSVLVLAFSLALDAVSVSVAAGVKAKKDRLRQALRVSIVFGLFQGAMPLLGWVVGARLRDLAEAYSPYLAFLLLVGVAVSMLIKGNKEEKDIKKGVLSNKMLFILAIATSIDALVVGISLGLVSLSVIFSAVIIGTVTFLLCVPAFLAGSRINEVMKGKIEVIASLALVLIGLKILLQAIL